MSDLLTRVELLASQRALEARLKEELRAKQDAFAVENGVFLETVALASKAVEETEIAIKAIAENQFAADGNKKPAPGVEVRMFKEYNIDEKAGLEWAKKTGMALVPEKLDLKAVQKIAAATPLDFVKVTEVPKVVIAQNLAKVLPEASPVAADAQV